MFPIAVRRGCEESCVSPTIRLTTKTILIEWVSVEEVRLNCRRGREPRLSGDENCFHFLAWFVIGPSDGVCMVRIFGEWLGDNSERCFRKRCNANIRPTEQRFQSQVCDPTAFLPNLLLRCISEPCQREFGAGMWNECIRFNGSIGTADVTRGQYEPSDVFVARDRRNVFRIKHVYNSSTSRRSSLGASPKNGSVPYFLPTP
jgi:hypothetical protein